MIIDILLWVGMVEVFILCLELFMCVEDSIFFFLVMKKMIEVVYDVIVLFASVGAALSVSCDGDMLCDLLVFRYFIVVGKVFGDDGGVFCVVCVDVVCVVMSLFVNVYEVVRRFRIYVVFDVDAEVVVVEFFDIDCVGVVINMLVGELSCDYMVRCVVIDVVNVVLCFGGVLFEDIFNLV